MQKDGGSAIRLPAPCKFDNALLAVLDGVDGNESLNLAIRLILTFSV